MALNILPIKELPGWVPDAVRLYLSHTGEGESLRKIARRAGCHPSTVLRQVRRFENRRDDPLVDEALNRLGMALSAAPCRSGHAATGNVDRPPCDPAKDEADMTLQASPETLASCDAATLSREARRILRRLCEAGTILAIAPDMDRAAVLKSVPGGQPARIAVLQREMAQAFALKEWIVCRSSGRVATYEITGAGRAALKRLLAEDENRRGFGEAATPFADQHRDLEARDVVMPDGRVERARFNASESPVAMLARRRDRDGVPFLGAELVAAAERLREDFELAQMGPRVAQNWDRFLTGSDRGSFGSGSAGATAGALGARERVAAALRDLGPGLGDVALRCCCFLEGLETTEKRMGWSARSGKIVLRIALTRLKRHYDEVSGGRAPLIG